MDNPANPLVSVAMCTYNGEKHLRQQLDSLVNQDYSNLEIVITDDRSSDDTWAILTEYANRYPFIRAEINEHNLGYAKNFEKAARLCKGKYIAFCDQDDVWSLNKISKMMAAAGDHILIYHDSSFIDETGDQVTAQFTSSSGSKVSAKTMSEHLNMYDGESPLPLLTANCISGHAMLFRRELMQYVPEFEPEFFHDWMLAWAAFNMGTVKYLPEALVQYRQHSNSITDVLNLRNEIARPAGKVKGIDRLYMDLKWIKHCAEFKYNKQPALIKKTYRILSALKEGRQRLAAFLFLSKYLPVLYYISRPRKSVLSTMNMVRKISFGA